MYKVCISPVRELFGILTAEKADHTILVTTSRLIQDARAFAGGKPMRLIAGKQPDAAIEKAKGSRASVQGGRSLGNIRHGHPARTNQRRALKSSRNGYTRCGASSFIKVRYGATNAHSSSKHRSGKLQAGACRQPTS